MTTPKAMPPSLITKELNEILTRVSRAGRSMTPAEVGRYEELEWERLRKEKISNEAKLADAKRLGLKIRSEANQKRLDGQTAKVKIVSRSNASQTEREAGIRARRAGR
jgi:hypothetical protein